MYVDEAWNSSRSDGVTIRRIGGMNASVDLEGTVRGAEGLGTTAGVRSCRGLRGDGSFRAPAGACGSTIVILKLKLFWRMLYLSVSKKAGARAADVQATLNYQIW